RRAARGTAQPDRSRRADGGDSRPACQRDRQDGEECQCARLLPHLSAYRRLRARRAGRDAGAGNARGGKTPRCLLSQPAMLEGADHGRTTQPGVMRDLLARADEYEKEPGINVVSIQVGFTWSDIPYTGPSIAVSHEPAAEARAKEIARLMIDE